MRYIVGFVIAFVSIAAFAADTDDLEKRLSSLETRAAYFISGKEKMTRGFSSVAPDLRQLACAAYPVASDKGIIKDLKKEIAFLEKKKNHSQLSADQVTRLAAQKNLVGAFTLGIDCAALQ